MWIVVSEWCYRHEIGKFDGSICVQLSPEASKYRRRLAPNKVSHVWSNEWHIARKQLSAETLVHLKGSPRCRSVPPRLRTLISGTQGGCGGKGLSAFDSAVAASQPGHSCGKMIAYTARRHPDKPATLPSSLYVFHVQCDCRPRFDADL